ncbi:MAG: hypothetical protein A2161_12290 [Candidatus Schekmanbacteria bacterium RBG_13_48_7]|uniref:Class III cytochrome C domain-containing protein n=1 Tax=Candidatus Schekmanbacteria bacterium RBG_13_48_7 TaxID=1817878 RepID=A0A1F7RTR0_9BACT|nr:MAG: hypothetical protein A2161_12290 [Candidatus Schekmanbacteria bacterium RBG_13_48_7]
MEKLGQEKLLKIVKKLTIPIVIAGISLSTLHQSSLGTLFLATPFRLHPLWYTTMLPIFFFISAIGLGCLTISWVTIIVHWLYSAHAPMDAISKIGRISSYFLGTYIVLKFGEIIVDGKTGMLFKPSWDIANFWFEIFISAIIPFALLLQANYRKSMGAMFAISTMALTGMSLNRINVAGLATLSRTKSLYFPAWSEWAVTLGILSAAGLFFLFSVEYFSIFTGIRKPLLTKEYKPGLFDHTDWKNMIFGGNFFGEAQLYSLAFIVAVGLCMGFLSDDAVFGVTPDKTPVYDARMSEVIKVKNETDGGARFFIPESVSMPLPDHEKKNVLMIDGNRNGRYVFFDHDMHITENGGKETSCRNCHHMNNPFESASRCSSCHSDMYLAADIFNHTYHMNKMGGNKGCTKCHTDLSRPKTYSNTVTCESCHMKMRVENSLINEKITEKNTVAPSYMDAMHKLCITCHKKMQSERKNLGENFSRCPTCHDDSPELTRKFISTDY